MYSFEASFDLGLLLVNVIVTTAKYHTRYSCTFGCYVESCIYKGFFAQTPCKLKETIKNDDQSLGQMREEYALFPYIPLKVETIGCSGIFNQMHFFQRLVHHTVMHVIL